MKLWDFCKKNQEISIYGCGKYGNLLKEFLDEKNVKIKSFIISDGQIKKENYGISSCFLSEWKRKYRQQNHGILIAVSKFFQEEIIANLEAENIKNYFVISEQDMEIKNIGVMDTTVGAVNHGNEIIMQAVYKYLKLAYEKDFIIKFPFLDDFGPYSIKFMEDCKYIFLGGTNALNSKMNVEKYIGVNEKNLDSLYNKVILMGVGWLCYESNPNFYTQKILNVILNKEILHSVRDSYTENKLKSIGVNNVINTGCPTIWGFDEEHCKTIPTGKSDEVIMMLTPRQMEQDVAIVKAIRENYKKIYFWIQSPWDYHYIKSLCPEAIQISSELVDLENFLETHKKIDYVGTRLHGGLKCLQHRKRTIIIAIDNRAIEMKNDFHLPVILPEEVEQLDDKINGDFITDIHLPKENIIKWLRQFDNWS